MQCFYILQSPWSLHAEWKTFSDAIEINTGAKSVTDTYTK